MEERFLRAKEAAQMLGIGKSTLWAYSKEGKLNPVRLSKRITVWRLSEIQAFMQAVA
jgi:predicted DNA-binding transcriptional regulator AlpA